MAETTAIDVIAPISVQVRRVMGQDSRETVAAKLEACQVLREWAKTVCKEIEDGAMEWIKEHGPVQVGQTLYWVALEKKDPKCVNIKGAIESLLDVCQGDIEKLTQFLSANAVKYGAAKAALSEEKYAELFKVEEVERLQSDDAEKAKKKLMKAPVGMIGKS